MISIYYIARLDQDQIYTQTLTGVCQVVRIISSCYFQVFMSIGTLVSNSLPLSTIDGTNGHGISMIEVSEEGKACKPVGLYAFRRIKK